MNANLSRKIGWLLLPLAGALAIRWGLAPRTGMPELHEHDPEMEQVADRLDALPAAQRLPYLLRQVNDPNPGMRLAAVDALEAFRSPAAAAAVEGAFGDYASRVRQRAVEVLPGIDPARGHRLLLRALQDEDGWIREAAANHLSMGIGRRDAFADQGQVPLLIRAQRDPQRTVAVLANSALRKLTGQKAETLRLRATSPPDQAQAVAARWEAWWSRQRAPGSPPTAPNPQRPTRSAPAPRFSIATTEGATLSRESLRGNVGVVHFWGTWCSPCQAEMPDLQAVHASFAGAPLQMLGIALAEPRGAAGVRQWCAEHRIRFPQALATDTVCQAFGDIHEVPVTFLIDPAGRIRYRFDGERDPGTLRAAIQHLLNEAPGPAPAPAP